MPRPARPKLLLAQPDGTVIEHPYLEASVRSGEELLTKPADRPVPLPEFGKLVHLPGRLPVGVDPETGDLELVRSFLVGRKRFTPSAVGALVPPGYTRTYLPGEVKDSGGPLLPQWAYTAAGWGSSGPVVWAFRTDRRTHWNPDRFSTTDLKERVKAHQKALPGNRVLKQLSTCALVYRCFTSQNVFYGRDEGAIPASIACNARCVGCISDQPEGGGPASHERMEEGPVGQEMTAVALRHLAAAGSAGARGERAMVSFGQGCEGEPLTRFRMIAEAIRAIRAETPHGSININTNASLPPALGALFDAGLDAVRVSLNSAVKDLYEAYYRPVKYGWEQVEASIALARDRGGYLALNLLTFPGVTDREGEVEALIRLVKRHRIDQIQTRSLCLDPLQYLEVARGKGAGGAPLGIRAMIDALKSAAPWLVIGNFARGKQERGAAQSASRAKREPSSPVSRRRSPVRPDLH